MRLRQRPKYPPSPHSCLGSRRAAGTGPQGASLGRLLSSRPLFRRSRPPEHSAKQVKRVSADLFRKANEFWHRHLALFGLDHPDYGVRPTDQVRKLALGEPRFFACFRQNHGNCTGGWASQSLKNDLCSEFRSDLNNPIIRCLDFLSAPTGLEWLSPLVSWRCWVPL
jgi:hypothetical protein